MRRSQSPSTRDKRSHDDRSRHNRKTLSRDRSEQYHKDERKRSRSRDRRHERRLPRSRSRSHSRSPSRSDDASLPGGVSSLSEADYFLRHAEYVEWLRKEKGKYFNELTGEKARSYFRKFVKAWNRGRLHRSYYTSTPGTSTAPASSNTNYKWSFVSKGAITHAELEAIDSVRAAAGSSAYSQSEGDPPFARSRNEGLEVNSVRTPRGPALPKPGDLILAQESAESVRAAEISSHRKRARAEERERVEDVVGPKPVGREGQLEKKRARRENDRAARDQKDDAIGDWDESVLMGGGDADSFQARIAQRDAARRRAEEKKGVFREERGAVVRERQEAMRDKERATMEMLKKMAKERFG